MSFWIFILAGVMSAATAALLAQPLARAGRNTAAVGAVVAVSLCSLGLYLFLGRPGLPDRPLTPEAEKAAHARGYAMLAEKPFEIVTKENPSDLSALMSLAEVNVALGRQGDAVRFYKRAFDVALLREDPRARRIGEVLGPLQVKVSRGRVQQDAWQTFHTLEKIDPGNALAADYLALYERQGR